MPALAKDVTNSVEEKLSRLNSASVITEEDAIQKLKDIRNLGGDLKRDRLFREIEKKFTGRLDIYSIDGVTRVLEDRIKNREISSKDDKVEDLKPKKEDPIVSNQKEDGRKVIDIREYKKKIEEEKNRDQAKNEIDKKIDDLSEKVSKDLKGDDALKEKAKEQIKKMVLDEEAKTSKEKVDDLSNVIAENLNQEKNTEIEVKAKEVKETVDKWSTENTEEVREYRKSNFKEQVEAETKKLNPDITEEQLNLVRKQSDLIASVYFGERGIDNQKESAITFNQEYFSPGTLENSWAKVEGIANLLTRSPKEVKDIKEQYDSLKKGLEGVKLPFQIKQFGSFDGIMSMFSDQATSNLFARTQNYLKWIDRFDRWTGGWINKTVVNWGEQFISRIGNQAVQSFAQNALNVVAKEGLQKGFSTIMNGIISGGVRAGATAAASGAAAGAAASGAAAGAATAASGVAAAGLSATGVGAIVVAAIAVLKVLKSIGTKIADKLGLHLGIKNFLKDTFGNLLGGLINFVVKVGMLIVGIPAIFGMLSFGSMAVPLVVGTTGGLLGYEMVQDNLVSSMVPPTDEALENIPEDEFITVGGITVPVCDAQNNNRTVLGDIARSIAGKVPYNRIATWRSIGPHSMWGKRVSTSASGYNPRHPWYGLDCAKFVSWVYYQCMPAERYDELGYSGHLEGNAASGKTGWKFVTQDELKVGDILYRPGHAGMFLGKDENGIPLMIHSNRNNNNPHIAKLSIHGSPGEVFTKFIRVSGVFPNDN